MKIEPRPFAGVHQLQLCYYCPVMQTPVSNCNLGPVAPSFKTVLHQIYPSLLDAYYTEGRRALKRYVYVKQHCMHMLSQAFIKHQGNSIYRATCRHQPCRAARGTALTQIPCLIAGESVQIAWLKRPLTLRQW